LKMRMERRLKWRTNKLSQQLSRQQPQGEIGWWRWWWWCGGGGGVGCSGCGVGALVLPNVQNGSAVTLLRISLFAHSSLITPSPRLASLVARFARRTLSSSIPSTTTSTQNNTTTKPKGGTVYSVPLPPHPSTPSTTTPIMTPNSRLLQTSTLSYQERRHVLTGHLTRYLKSGQIAYAIGIWCEGKGKEHVEKINQGKKWGR
jgi:hypothetical protein